MKKTGLLITAFAVLLSGCAATAGEPNMESGSKQHGKEMMMGMAKMDANNDGVIAKDEFMKSHEMMFERMKNKDGVIEAKKMENCCAGMMGDGMKAGMMGGDKMKGHSMMEGCPMMDGHMAKGK